MIYQILKFFGLLFLTNLFENMKLSYLIRLDDACPTFHYEKWNKMERLLDKYNIKPIIAIVPDNLDEDLIYQKPVDNFWHLVSNWKSKEWVIGLHGYQHVLHKTKHNLLRINDYSEFTGLSESSQTEKLTKALKIFYDRSIKPDIWVAPAHGFDNTTLSILKSLDMTLISDGFSFRAYKRDDIYWIPQQFWRTRYVPFGLWTINYHPNTMSEADFINLESFFAKNQNHFISLKDITFSKYSIIDYTIEKLYTYSLFMKKIKREICLIVENGIYSN